ncbi:hypothetical protein AcW1_004173 [Taiwanofungus camphoratus]|nr:hypothetical protein AcV5_000555 [Antrodia cinnamomea]KAI0951944.1 hypothetical protein AcV7_007896 [Antrodia cinnamomea]KAI0959315.1 hypothetical protein AcW1_004173 [Antrodia cinnamomea]
MVLWLLFLFPLSTFASIEKTHGVPPSLLSRYEKPGSASAPWSCLDGSKTITWASVNDDYCDCSDGSDEPGTGACPNTVFYCRNEGHIGAYIPSTRVGDGLCELECCDGSDERPGTCPNTCKEVGEAYQINQAEERKIRKTGSKIRSSYISFAQKEKKRIDAQIIASEQEIAVREKEVVRLKDLVDRSESLSAAALEHKKESPLYKALISHSLALKSLQREHQIHLEREKALGDILDALRLGYNPNYQDMAVLEAVRGWEYLAGLPHINDVRKEEGAEEQESSAEEQSEEELEEGMWTEEQLEKELDGLLKTDYETLLLEHDKHVGAPTAATGSLSLRDSLVSWLEALGIARGTAPASTADTSRARKAFNDAEHSLDLARQELQKAQEELSRLFDSEWFGPEGEWKKLQGTCLQKDTGDYTYEVCLFDEARQKPNKGGSSQSLGKFTSWNNAAGVTPGTPEYYGKQHYTRGSKCWNGPMRSVTLTMSCGTENALLSVAEPEKCEYQFAVTSPALCLPPEASEEKREEL